MSIRWTATIDCDTDDASVVMDAFVAMRDSLDADEDGAPYRIVLIDSGGETILDLASEPSA